MYEMNDTRKVSASSGAEWLLGGFGLLRKAPLGLGLLGAIFGALAAVVSLIGMATPTLILPLQLAMTLLGPLLIGGMTWAAREVDAGRAAQPGQLLQGVREGKTARLLATLLPQIVAGVLLVLLLLATVGIEPLQRLLAIAEQSQAGTRIDPSQVEGLPFGRFLLWALMALVIGILAGFFTFTAIADIMLGNAGAFDAMKRSFRACLRNIGAMVVFFVLLIIAAIALSIAVQLVALLVKAFAGEQAMAFFSQVFLLAVLMPVVVGSMYFGWKQMVAGGTAAPAQERVGGFEA